MLRFTKTSDFLLVDIFQLRIDGTVGWLHQPENAAVQGGFIRPGMHESIDVSTGEQDEDGNEIIETQQFDVWAKYCELRDNGTITVQPVPQAELDAIAAEQAKQAERQSKLNAYTFKGVSCSVNESDQNGWETVNARVKRLVASGETWRDFPFFMDNGNYVMIESEAEWDAFVEAGWQAREAIMMARLSS